MLASIRRPSVARVIIAANLSILLFTAIVVAMLLTSQNTLKVHGPVYDDIKASADLTADILPPPLYLQETFLTVLQLQSATDVAGRQQLIAHLDELEKGFNDRRTYWASQRLPADIQNAIQHRLGPDAQAIFDAVRTRFLPALRNNRGDEVAAAVAAIGTLYARHRGGVDDLVKMANKSVDDAEASASATETVYLRVTYVILTLTLAVAIGATVLLIGMIARPVQRMTEVMRALAGGDKSITVPALGRKDEIGAMAQSVQVFKDNMIETDQLRAAQEAQKQQAAAEQRHAMLALAGKFEAKIAHLVGLLASSATEMEATARSMSATAGQTTQQAATVATAAQEASAGVQTVAASAEELSSSISEISRQVAQSSRITEKAVSDARRTDTTVRALADGAQRIGQVVELIRSIAGQTNLLALNATIEAARAGDAGKGFAVVASEVKGLAGQTAKATEEIAAQIAQLQSETTGAVEAIRGITAVIEEVSQIATAIASAVEQQGAATAEIARNVQQTAGSAQLVTTNIAGVSQGAASTGAAADEVLSAAGELSRQAESLSAEVTGFVSDVRAA